MIGLDTNVLLRFLIKDDEKQAARSARAIREAAQRGEPLTVGPVVLCEMVWVLTSSYGYARSEIVASSAICSRPIAWTSSTAMSCAPRSATIGRTRRISPTASSAAPTELAAAAKR